MNNKEITLQVADAFTRSDVDTILNYFADAIEWHMLGDKVYQGKETIKQMFTGDSSMKIITCTQDHVIAEGDTVAIDGYVECTGKDEKMIHMYYCDLYELEDGKVKKMISYTVDKKK